MRKLKRFLRRIVRRFTDRPRLSVVQKSIQEHLQLQKPPRLSLRGANGHDSIYRVTDAGNPIGILRLTSHAARRAAPSSDMPYRIEPDAQRLEREWAAYTTGFQKDHLTPAPLWHDTDALLCSYLPYPTLHDALIQNPQDAWSILTRAARAIHTLHQAGITHMDISLKNMLSDPITDKIFFVDFEYAPAPDLSSAEQRLYDHLRLVESSWKFILEKHRYDWSEWLQVFHEVASTDLQASRLVRLKPALTRILSDAAFVQSLHASPQL